MRLLLIMYLVLLVPVCLFLLTRARRAPGRVDHAAELRELEASRDLIDRLLDAAVDRRDVDSLLAPVVIDEIRSHQRTLRQHRDDKDS